MVITQEPTQPLATLHRFITTRFHDPTEQQDVGLPLMIPLSMVMRNIFAQRPPQRALTKENEFDKHSSFTDLTQRSAKAFKFGLRAGSGSVLT